jgi:hypothetical protein
MLPKFSLHQKREWQHTKAAPGAGTKGEMEKRYVVIVVAVFS